MLRTTSLLYPTFSSIPQVSSWFLTLNDDLLPLSNRNPKFYKMNPPPSSVCNPLSIHPLLTILLLWAQVLPACICELCACVEPTEDRRRASDPRELIPYFLKHLFVWLLEYQSHWWISSCWSLTQSRMPNIRTQSLGHFSSQSLGNVGPPLGFTHHHW